MTFYVRRSKDSQIEGPFTIEQLNKLVGEKRLNFNSLAIVDRGQGLSGTCNTPVGQWIRVAELPGYEPDPTKERSWLRIFVVILIIVALLVVIGLAKFADILHRIH